MAHAHTHDPRSSAGREMRWRRWRAASSRPAQPSEVGAQGVPAYEAGGRRGRGQSARAHERTSWQVPHDCGQSDSIDAGFFSHSPLLAQSRQAGSLSVHTTEHTPHVFGQSRITAPGLARHSASPQTSHCVAFLSSHALAWHTSHDAEHVLRVNPGLSWHWPAVAQPGQSLCVSLHSSRHTPHDTGQCFSMNSACRREARSHGQRVRGGRG